MACPLPTAGSHFEHDLVQEPISTPDQVRGRLFGIMLSSTAAYMIDFSVASVPANSSTIGS
jgi:hypothetical protein